MKRVAPVIVLAGIWGLIACGSPTGPSAAAPPPPSGPTEPEFAVRGSVIDPAGRPVDAATIEVVDGPRTGAIALSDFHGRFAFAGMFTTDTTLLASKAGYREKSISFSTTHGLRGGLATFLLESASPPVLSSGPYSITFAVDSGCTSLPEVVSTRTYTIMLAENASWTVAKLVGGVFGRVDPNAGHHSDWDDVQIGIVDDFARVSTGEPGIWEHITSDTYLVIEASAQGTVNATGGEFALSGRFVFCPASQQQVTEPACQVREVTCTSPNHKLTLRRTG